MKSKIINVVLAIALLGTGVWSYQQYQTRLNYETFIQNQNQRSYLDFASNLENLESLTSKSLVSTSGQNRAMLLSDIWWQSNFAQQNLAQLPFDGGAIRKTTKFLTQLGDYSYALAKKSSKDIPMSNGEINKLQDLHNQVGVFGEELRKISEKNGRDAKGFSELKTISFKADNASTNLMQGTFNRLDKQMQQY